MQSQPYPQPLKSFTFPNPNSDKVPSSSVSPSPSVSSERSNNNLVKKQLRKITENRFEEEEDVSGLNSLSVAAVLSRSNSPLKKVNDSLNSDEKVVDSGKSSRSNSRNSFRSSFGRSDLVATTSTGGGANNSPPLSLSSSSRNTTPSTGEHTPDTSAFKITVSSNFSNNNNTPLKSVNYTDGDGDSSMNESGSSKWPSNTPSNMSSIITGNNNIEQQPVIKDSDTELRSRSESESGSGVQSTTNPTRPSSASKTQQPPDPTLASLLGTGSSTWNYSDKSLIQALQLKAEQEKTKQEFYRLEIWHRSLEMIKDAIAYNVPPTAIPLLFQSINGSVNPGGVPQTQQQQQSSVAAAAAVAAATAASVGSISVDASPKHEPVHLVPSVKADRTSLSNVINLDRERFPGNGHQRNLSLPPQMNASEYSRQIQAQQSGPSSQGQQGQAAQSQQGQTQSQAQSQSQSQPQSQSQSQLSPQHQPSALVIPQTNPFRPGHTHHASLSAISTYSPNRYSNQPRPSWQSNPQIFPPPAQPTTVVPTSPSSSLQHITFHHWTPNQSKGAAVAGGTTTTPSQTATPTTNSPKKDAVEEQQVKRRKSISDRPGSPPSRPTNSPLIASHANIRKRGLGHSRHRSEASVLRGGDIRPWSASQPSSFSRFQPQHQQIHQEQQSGVNVLATVAAAESDRQQQTAQGEKDSSFSPQSEERERSRKHNVDFMITQQNPPDN